MAAAIDKNSASGPAQQDESTTDYADPASWYKIPEITKDADTFYIYPTVFIDIRESAQNYASIGNPIMTAGVRMNYELQACVFEESTNLFVPYYRQANLKVLLQEYAYAPDFDITDLLKDRSPQRDIWAALDYYFDNLNNGRPFILAGHSQGSTLARMILKDYFKEHPEYYERMIAAYVLGFSITKDDLEQNPHLRFAERPDDTGVIVSWNIEGPGNKNAQNIVVLENSVSINPLNWKRDDTYASADENHGSWRLNEKTNRYELANLHADAQVDPERGVVICTTRETPFIYVGAGLPELFGPESFNKGDYSLYFKNIQENIKTRIEAWKSKAKS
ncbi:DUF3089 domain-containing protein [bacterium]|nr:DUF3089 domain-containing protein [bacterium]